MWIEREMAAALSARARSFPAVVLTGPRQVGKTSLLRRQFAGYPYLTFDDLALQRQAETSPEAFLDAHPAPLVLDEVQYVPALFRNLKRRIDEGRRRGSYLMTGSQTFQLMEGVAESLAGRAAILEMSSLSHREVARGRAVAEGDFLVRGGFPELWAEPGLEGVDFYSSYVATYLERDVRNLKQVGDLRDFDRFLRAAAIRTGQLLSYADLARDVGVAPNTVKAWLSVLVASGQVLLLEPYHRALGKRLVKSPKLYFLDTGLVCHLVGVRDFASLLSSPLSGALWETYVVGQVVRHFQSARERPPLWFFRTPRGEEVDLLIEHGGRFIAIECKLAETPGPEAARGFAALDAFYGERVVKRAFVACRAAHAYTLAGAHRATVTSVDELVGAL
jgi:predicted AAA+ superfamily ATPase